MALTVPADEAAVSAPNIPEREMEQAEPGLPQYESRPPLFRL